MEEESEKKKKEEERSIWKARKLLLCFKPDLHSKKEKSSQSKGTSNGDKKLPSSSTT